MFSRCRAIRLKTARPIVTIVRTVALAGLLTCLPALAGGPPADLLQQTEAKANENSAGCRSCHGEIEPMHASPQVKLACPDCHGGTKEVSAEGLAPGSPAYDEAKARAHVQPINRAAWTDAAHPTRLRSANPARSYTALNHESPAYVRFINPGDLRVAAETCGKCHTSEVHRVHRSLMATTAMLWGGAAYNNGIVPRKRYIFGESYSRDGVPQQINGPAATDPKRGILSFLLPLPRWNVVQPPDPFRAFERGGRIDRSNVSEVGNPNLGPLLDEPGRPDMKFGTRGLGTDLRISAGVLNIHKTRLNDPDLWFLGTNDQPGDYRSSGCTACHVVYANDRDPTSAGPYSQFGNLGTYQGKDPTIPRGESGHPIQHRLTRAIPTSQCMVCHMHQPNAFLNTYLGYQMWDYETDGELLWPPEQRYATIDAPTPFDAKNAAPAFRSLVHNPEEAAVRGLWTDTNFLAGVKDLPSKDTKFADYHGHGWVFRSVYSQDRKGNLLDKNGKVVDWNDPAKLSKAVHLNDIHAEKGMHCVDCHFEQDVHGDDKLYSEYPDAIEIGCRDCHGSIFARAHVSTSGPAAGDGHSLLNGVTPFGQRRFEWVENRLMQRSMVQANLEWPVTQVLDSITPGSDSYNEKSRLAKTMQRDGKTWGNLPSDPATLAHADSDMACYTCHTSWVTSCFGCHLPQQANWKKDSQHFEGGESRNWTSYNPQVLRNDIFMLAKHSIGKNSIIAPARSSSAVVLSTVNANRERLYTQQPPVSAEGFSSQAFNAHFAHTVRARETKQCTDCHVSAANDNNAWLSQVLTLGTSFVNFMGHHAWVGEGTAGFEAVSVSEWDEPQAIVGSRLHHLAYPANYARHVDGGSQLRDGHHHGGDSILSLQLRGEYLYTADGSDGLRVFDVANVDNKGFSERIITAPVSPLGQRAYVPTKFATSVALPTNQPIHYGRARNAEVNGEQPMHRLYKYAYVADLYEGLIVVDVDVLADGDPRNNFLRRSATFNPDGQLDGARYVAIAGDYAYVLCKRGLVIVGINDPTDPHVVAELGAPDLIEPRAIVVQFRYAFLTDARGLQIVDVTEPQHPTLVSHLDIAEAGELHVARTYAYVPAGSQGLAIVDVEKPAFPSLVTMYTAAGQLNDVRSVRVAAAYGSVYAYVADGKNGLRVLQLIAAGEDAGAPGFSPMPNPRLIATYPTHGPALTLSRGLERDRAVDESGNQIAVFGRFGSRPFTRAEMERLFLRDGKVFTVADTPPSKPEKLVRIEEPTAYSSEPGANEVTVQPAAPQPERLLPGRR